MLIKQPYLGKQPRMISGFQDCIYAYQGLRSSLMPATAYRVVAIPEAYFDRYSYCFNSSNVAYLDATEQCYVRQKWPVCFFYPKETFSVCESQCRIRK
uniref:BPTI/Kunitz inhibitor domain-containing protein n=1 Tax=Macrostomum lignano TaxID=282301 RepID=A0A1I8FAY4_9PLAT